jgi:predicted RNA-binding Zn-ribbon protein involved in translation (DUF1610 family)
MEEVCVCPSCGYKLDCPKNGTCMDLVCPKCGNYMIYDESIND